MKPVIRALATVALLLSACSSMPEPEGPSAAATPATAPAAQTVTTPVTPSPSTTSFDPVGHFDFSAEFQGQSQPGSLNITRGADGKLGAVLVGGNNEQLQASSVVAEGRKVTINATIPGGPEITFTMNFENNDKFTGTLGVQGMSGNITGTRKKS